MKIVSKCEKDFITNAVIRKQKRLDGRELSQGRTLEIVFGSETGCCMVLQGNTLVLSQVNCEISEPKPVTPNEGIIHVNMELSAMASPDLKSQSKSSDEAKEAQRSIERCIRDTKCIELESLCIVKASKVWTIRVNIHTLNDDGNVTECASIAAISALAHFRRPEVTVSGTDVTVHSSEEKEPVALNLHHMPISINLALFENGKFILVDPNEMEEKVCDGLYNVEMNAHQEVCHVHRRGVMLLNEEAVERCTDIAIKRAQEVTQVIRKALDDDAYKRATNTVLSFDKLIATGTILGAKCPVAEVCLDSVQNLQHNTEPEDSIQEVISDEEMNYDEKVIGDSPQVRSSALERARRIVQDSETAVFEGGPSKWGEDTDEDSSEEETMDTKDEISGVKEEIDLDSEEEEAVFINQEQLDVKTPSSRAWYSKDPFM